MGESRKCRVCNDKSDGAHFGVDACRACAAFFRRSIVMKKKYVCRQGSNTCDIDKAIRCMCRACRFRKCLAIGMSREAVQNPRDQIGRRSGDSAEGEEVISDAAYLDYYNDCIKGISIDVVQSQPSPSFQEGTPYLTHLNTEYNKLMHKRRHYAMDPEPHKGPRAVPSKYAHKILLLDYPNVIEYVSAFPRIDELRPDQKRLIFREFFSLHLFADSNCSTVLQFPGCTTKLHLLDGNYVDLDNLHIFFDGDKIMTPEEAARTFRPSFDIMVNSLLKPIMELHMSPMEMMALRAFTVYQTGLEGETDHTNAICHQARDQIYRELLFHYNSGAQGLVPEPGVRLAKIVALLPGLQRVVVRHWEDLLISKVFSDKVNEILINIYRSDSD